MSLTHDINRETGIRRARRRPICLFICVFVLCTPKIAEITASEQSNRSCEATQCACFISFPTCRCRRLLAQKDFLTSHSRGGVGARNVARGLKISENHHQKLKSNTRISNINLAWIALAHFGSFDFFFFFSRESWISSCRRCRFVQQQQKAVNYS